MPTIERKECSGSMQQPTRYMQCPVCKRYEGLTLVGTVPSHIIVKEWRTREEGFAS